MESRNSIPARLIFWLSLIAWLLPGKGATTTGSLVALRPALPGQSAVAVTTSTWMIVDGTSAGAVLIASPGAYLYVAGNARINSALSVGGNVDGDSSGRFDLDLGTSRNLVARRGGAWRVWEHDANNYIALLGTGRMDFYVGGQRCAVLDQTGKLWLRGYFQELPYASDTQQSALISENGEIEYHAANGSISFAVKREADSVPVQVAELFPSGNLRFHELTEWPSYPTAYWHKTTYNWDDSEALDLSPDLQQRFVTLIRLLVGGATNAEFHVREIRENAL